TRRSSDLTRVRSTAPTVKRPSTTVPGESCDVLIRCSSGPGWRRLWRTNAGGSARLRRSRRMNQERRQTENRLESRSAHLGTGYDSARHTKPPVGHIGARPPDSKEEASCSKVGPRDRLATRIATSLASRLEPRGQAPPARRSPRRARRTKRCSVGSDGLSGP